VPDPILYVTLSVSEKYELAGSDVVDLKEPFKLWKYVVALFTVQKCTIMFLEIYLLEIHLNFAGM